MMDGYAAHAIVRESVAAASDALGENLWELMQNGPADALNLTRNTQPVMLAAGVAVWRAWCAAGGPAPSVMAGHSLGEYSALVAAESLRFEDAVPLVRFRADAMQDAVPAGEGAMAAVIGADDAAVAEACRDAAQGQVVEAVNFNAPGQLVIAGHRGAVERAIVAAKARGAKRAMLLPVSAPFHSSLLAPAAERLGLHLAHVDVRRPSIPVIHDVDVATHDAPDDIRRALARQAASPVRWTEIVRRMADEGVTHIVECGPGKVLAGLVRRIAEGVETYSLTDGAAIDETLAAVAGARG
jgi:[acyl-carrier-protein] S-malonyltransferase